MKEKVIDLINQKNSEGLSLLLKQIKKLDLSNSTISDEQVIFLADNLQNNSTIYFVNLKKNKITDLGAKAISQMMELNHKITALMIQYSHIKNPDIKVKIANFLLRNNSERNIEVSERNAKIAAELKEAEEENEDLKQEVSELQSDAEKEKEKFESELALAVQERKNIVEALENDKKILEAKILKLKTKATQNKEAFETESSNLNSEIKNLNVQLHHIKQEMEEDKVANQVSQQELNNLINNLKLELEKTIANASESAAIKELEFQTKLSSTEQQFNAKIIILEEKVRSKEANLKSYIDKAEKDLKELKEYRTTLEAQNKMLLLKEEELRKEIISVKQSNETVYPDNVLRYEDYIEDMVPPAVKPLGGCDIL